MHWASRSTARRGVDDIELERTQWCERLELMSRECAGLEAALVCGEPPRAGQRRSCVRLPLREIRFDEGEDLVTMALGGASEDSPELTFYIEHPRRIRAAESPEGQSLLFTERCGVDVRVLVPTRREAMRHAELQRGRFVRGPAEEMGSAAP